MGKYIENEVEYYYDSHPTVEDLMGETSYHAELVYYLMGILKWLFRGQICAIYENLNFYQTPDPLEYPIAPDIAVIKGEEYDHRRNWTVGKAGPAPQVVFEIASKETWRNDLREKPLKYAHMGVEEYFLYDPETPMNMKRVRSRLIGWQLNTTARTMEEMWPDQRGRLWSQHLESFLVPDGTYLRLYDREGQRRLTEAEAHAENERLAEQQARVAEQQARLAEQQARLAEQRARMLEEKLRALGMNPDEL